MLLKSDIHNTLNRQSERFLKKATGIEREKLSGLELTEGFILIITGVRRCGKSTLLHQLGQKSDEKPRFINFEDPTLFDFEAQDFNKLIELLEEDHVCFFDEIQNADKWEIFFRALHDQGKILCLTGSNASLLSRELGTRLTGRHIQTELFPFSYSEFLSFKKLDASVKSLKKYTETGGFPEYVKFGRREVLQQLLKDIVYRDIIVRHGIRNADNFMRITLFLLSSVGKEYSINGIKNTFEVGSVASVSDYISWLEESYLIFSLPRFSWSLKSVAKNKRKVYAIDTGFVQANTLSSSRDEGRLFENMVFLHLRRIHPELYYFREKGECDFVVKELEKVTHAYQACLKVTDDNKRREVNGLLEALQFFNLQEGYIITIDQEDEWEVEGKKIKIIPAWRWLLNALKL